MPIATVCARLELWVYLVSTALCAQAEGGSITISSSSADSVEKKLKQYLTKRVLVFRKNGIGRRHVKFDSPRRSLAESSAELSSHPNAILFLKLALDGERSGVPKEQQCVLKIPHLPRSRQP